MTELKTTIIDISKISVPEGKESDAFQHVLQEMADEIKSDGWKKGRELGVKDLGNGRYEVHASFSWFAAAQLADVKSIPCNIY